MGNVRSHVGIPKALLKGFAKSGSVWVLNRKANTIVRQGLRVATTTFGYYDDYAERELCDNVEQELGKIRKFVLANDDNVAVTNFINSKHQYFERFFKYQLNRSKKQYEMVRDNSIMGSHMTHSDFIAFTKRQKANPLSLIHGKKCGMLLRNDSKKNLITNSLGFYIVFSKNKSVSSFIIPLSASRAIVIEKGFDIKNPYSHYTVDDCVVAELNKRCKIFEEQLGNGFLIAEKEADLYNI